MAMPEIPPDLAKSVPGVLGSLTALIWIKEPWPRKLAMFLAGGALSHFGTGPVANIVGLESGLTGYLLGLFGMAIVAKTFETWAAMDLGGIASAWLRRVLGLPVKE